MLAVEVVWPSFFLSVTTLELSSSKKKRSGCSVSRTSSSKVPSAASSSYPSYSSCLIRSSNSRLAASLSLSPRPLSFSLKKILLRPERSLMSTRRRFPTNSGYVLVSGGLFEHGADMDAPFVREGAAAYERRIVAKSQVRQLGHKTGGGGKVRKALGADGCMAQLQLQHRNDRAKVGVAAAFAVSVDRALHMGRPLLDGSDRVRHAQVAIVVGVDPDHAVQAPTHFSKNLHQARGDRPSVGVAQNDRIRAGGLRRFDGAQSKGGIRDVAVEEMLGVVDHFFAVLLQIRHGFGNQRQVFLLGNAQGAAGM